MPYSEPTPFVTGSRGEYQWLTTAQHDLNTLLRLCPQAALDKYIAVTSLDSGPLVLKGDEIAAGWESRNEIAYSPRIQVVEKLPNDRYDEWYIFTAPADLGQMTQGDIFEVTLQPGLVAVFVNYGGFALQSPVTQDLVGLFWTQLEWIHPESYVADGDLLNFVSRNNELFTTVSHALSGG